MTFAHDEINWYIAKDVNNFIIFNLQKDVNVLKSKLELAGVILKQIDNSNFEVVE